MDGAWLRRLRWRRRGAWMWPAFILLTVVDALIGHALPPAGDGWNAVGAAVTFGAINLVGIVVLSFPVVMLMRRRRPDLPKVVAKDYSGTTTMAAITVIALGIGLANHGHVDSDASSMNDAIIRAQAFIGDRAPDRFRRNLRYVEAMPIQNGSVYRVCVPSDGGAQTYCVVVNTTKPFSDSVTFSGYESNQMLSEGFN